MSSPNFISKMPTAGLTALGIGGAAVIASYARLRELLLARAGRDVANLFAEPVSGGEDASISWYAEIGGEPVALKQLDAEAGQLPRKRLRELLQALDPLLGDAELGPLLSAALWVASPEDIVSVGGQPVLTGWGFLPNAVAASSDARRRHFAATIGNYAPFDANRLLQGPVTPVPVAAAAGEAVLVEPLPSRPEFWRGWRIGAAAFGAAVLVLLVLLIPGVLRYGFAGDDPVVALTARQRQINETLAEKVATLKAGLAGAQCTPGGLTTSPGGSDPPASLPPPDPKETKAPPSAGGLPSIDSLDAFLDAAVVMVIGNFEDNGRSGSTQGSGFVIGPGLIVTNHHVVEHVKPGELWVVNHKLGRAVAATVVEQTEKTAPYPDFAVLKIDAPVPLPNFQLSTKAKRLMDILVVGYTGHLVERDLNYRKLREGDPTAIPDMDVAPGIISVMQSLLPGVDAIVHSAAAASHGNSGGPMVDRCGRVLGVHTYGWDPKVEKKDDEEGNAKGDESKPPYKVTIDFFRYAEATSTLIKFLDEKNIKYELADGACDPQRVASVMPPAAAPPTVAPAPAPPAATPPKAADPAPKP
jgi:hypothetical protein